MTDPRPTPLGPPEPPLMPAPRAEVTLPPSPAGTTDVVVAHYRAEDDLHRCLRSLLADGAEGIGRVVVVDGEAGPSLGDVLRAQFPRVTYLPVAENVGFAGLVNRGLRATSSSAVLVLNADVLVSPADVRRLAAHLDVEPGCGLVAPRMSNLDGSLQASTFRFHRPLTVVYRRTPLGRLRLGRDEQVRFLDAERRDAAIALGRPVHVDWVLGAVMMVRRAALPSTGLLDERYFLYFEDVDWCLRFWLAGWTVTYLPTAVALHRHGRGSARGGLLAPLLNTLTRVHLRSAARFFRHHGPDGPTAARPMAAGLHAAPPPHGPAAPALGPTAPATLSAPVAAGQVEAR